MAASAGSTHHASVDDGAAAFHASLATASAATALFCPHCGTMLVLPSSSVIVCSSCAFRCRYSDLEGLETTTSSRQRPPAQWLKEAMGVKEDESDGSKKHRATVEEECPECKNPRMSFYTMQMRSVDEGQTVFYECEKCGYTFSTNT